MLIQSEMSFYNVHEYAYGIILINIKLFQY